jgi:hypothetical protein
MVLVMAAIVGAEHVLVFLLVLAGAPTVLITLARIAQFALLGYLFWRNRGSRLLPTSAAERELWTIWIGYFTVYFFIVIVTRLLMHFDILQVNQHWQASGYFRELLPYPFIALVSGLAFFIMGANYWGRCYAIGAVFFIIAPLMTLDLTYAPLLFGIVWTIALVNIGLHLRTQGRPAPALVAPSQAATVQSKEHK